MVRSSSTSDVRSRLTRAFEEVKTASIRRPDEPRQDRSSAEIDDRHLLRFGPHFQPVDMQTRLDWTAFR